VSTVNEYEFPVLCSTADHAAIDPSAAALNDGFWRTTLLVLTTLTGPEITGKGGVTVVGTAAEDVVTGGVATSTAGDGSGGLAEQEQRLDKINGVRSASFISKPNDRSYGQPKSA
jgi:hypothetical protein